MSGEIYRREDFDYELAWSELRSERTPVVPPREEVGSGHWLVLRERLLETFARARLEVPAHRPMTAEELRHHARHTLVVWFDDASASIQVFQIPDAEIEGESEDSLASSVERGEWVRCRMARYGSLDDPGRQSVDTRLLDTRVDRVLVVRREG